MRSEYNRRGMVLYLHIVLKNLPFSHLGCGPWWGPSTLPWTIPFENLRKSFFLLMYCYAMQNFSIDFRRPTNFGTNSKIAVLTTWQFWPKLLHDVSQTPSVTWIASEALYSLHIDPSIIFWYSMDQYLSNEPNFIEIRADGNFWRIFQDFSEFPQIFSNFSDFPVSWGVPFLTYLRLTGEFSEVFLLRQKLKTGFNRISTCLY